MDKKVLILSIDGGGIRGLIAASFLAQLEKDLDRSLYDTFDMFAGSSTGSFITLAISALQYDGKKILSLFNETNIKKIFSKSFFSFLSAFYGTKYKGKGKREVLNQIFADKLFLDIKKQTLITAYDLIHNYAVIFKSQDKDGIDAANNLTIAEVADASTAAPTYFPTVKTSGKKPRWLIDGGISANDPTICILSAAIHMGYRVNDIKILSLGTGIRTRLASDPQKFGKASQRWGGLEWLKHGIIDDLFSGSASVAEYQAAQLLKGNYYRVNHPLLSVQDEMDNIAPSNLQALAELGKQWYQQHRTDILSWYGAANNKQ